MLSADGSAPVVDAWLQEQQRILFDYAKKIDLCIDAADWGRLSSVLDGRQKYLEQLFHTSSPDGYRDGLTQMAQTILQQDQEFQARIQRQKKLATHQQQSIQLGRRALEAYSDQ